MPSKNWKSSFSTSFFKFLWKYHVTRFIDLPEYLRKINSQNIPNPPKLFRLPVLSGWKVWTENSPQKQQISKSLNFCWWQKLLRFSLCCLREKHIRGSIFFSHMSWGKNFPFSRELRDGGTIYFLFPLAEIALLAVFLATVIFW